MDTSVLPSLISAGAVLAGAALQQGFAWLGKRSEYKLARHKLRCDKLEQIADLLYQSQLASLAALALLATDDPGKEPQAPARQRQDELALRVCSLSLLFFPSLQALADDFLKASYTLQLALESGDIDKIVAAAKSSTKLRKAMEQELACCAVKLGFHG